MRYIYACTLTPDEDGGFVASFPDVPEALTGSATKAETLALAEDALAAALAGYVHDHRDIPAPSPLTKGQYLVAVPPVVAAKLALYKAMHDQGLSKVALAERLGISESAIRKLVNPDHRSHIGQVETALRAIGRVLVVEDKAA